LKVRVWAVRFRLWPPKQTASGGYFFAYFLDIISQFKKSSETNSTGSAERNVQTTFPLLYESFQLIHHQNISIRTD